MLRKSFLLLPLAALFLTACPDDNNPGPDAGACESNADCAEGQICDTGSQTCKAEPNVCEKDADCGIDQVCDTDTGDCVEKWRCTNDFECTEPGQVCDENTGECEAGVTCDPAFGNANCNSPEMGDGCGGDDQYDCICDPVDNTCKERQELCMSCTRDAECGDDYGSFREYTATCESFDDGKYCLRFPGPAGCPRGYEPAPIELNGADYCVPADGGTCDSVWSCSFDADCPEERPICNKSNGLCTKGCTFDIDKGESTCPAGQVCDYDGKCRLPCDPANDQCSQIADNFVCKEDTGSVLRCRPDGCIDSKECPVADPETGYTGFCDVAQNVCVDDRCRPDLTDPKDKSNGDCTPGWSCSEAGECYKMTCAERNSGSNYCGLNELCCDSCRNALGDPTRDDCDPWVCDGSELPSADPDNPDGCVQAPTWTPPESNTSPWCQGCGGDTDCAYVSPKEAPRDRNFCSQGLCLNTCSTNYDCPRPWACNYLYMPCDPTQESPCGAAGTCVDDGTWGPDCGAPDDEPCPDGTECMENPEDGTMQCHAPWFVCNCGVEGTTDKGTDANCPEGGTLTRCAPTGYSTHTEFRCVVSKVCTPQSGVCEE